MTRDAGLAAAADGSKSAQPATVRQPTPPDKLPDHLPGRWKVSLCVACEQSHAWIRYQNVKTGEVRSISRYHLFTGGWFDSEQLRFKIKPSTRSGLYMDREQSMEAQVRQGQYLLLSTIVDNPKIYRGESVEGHDLVVNNCVTYTRDAWQFYTGEQYELPSFHAPSDLRHAVAQRHPQVLKPARSEVQTATGTSAETSRR